MGPSAGEHLREDICAQHWGPGWPWKALILHSQTACCFHGLSFLWNMLQKDAISHLNWSDGWWVSGVELLIWGEDCGNCHHLPRAAVKSDSQLPAVRVGAHSDSSRGLELEEEQTGRDLRQLLMDLLLLGQRQCGSSKKGRNIQAKARRWASPRCPPQVCSTQTRHTHTHTHMRPCFRTCCSHTAEEAAQTRSLSTNWTQQCSRSLPGWRTSSADGWGPRLGSDASSLSHLEIILFLHVPNYLVLEHLPWKSSCACRVCLPSRIFSIQNIFWRSWSLLYS